MVIKVLKVGDNVERTKDIECPKCHSELQYSKVDVHYQGLAFKGEGEEYHYLVCPMCSHRIHVDSPVDL